MVHRHWTQVAAATIESWMQTGEPLAVVGVNLGEMVAAVVDEGQVSTAANTGWMWVVPAVAVEGQELVGEWAAVAPVEEGRV